MFPALICHEAYDHKLMTYEVGRCLVRHEVDELFLLHHLFTWNSDLQGIVITKISGCTSLSLQNDLKHPFNV